MTRLEDTIYSFPFNFVMYLGTWMIDSNNKVKLGFYGLYKIIILAVEAYGLHGLVKDLINELGDLNKMSWNVCITTLLMTIFAKSLHLLDKYKTVNRLRRDLHEDAQSRLSAGDDFFEELAAKEMKMMRLFFYIAGSILVPTWLGYKYFVNRELSVPFQVPEGVDLTNDYHYNSIFAFLSFFAVIVLLISIETELAMFSILIQISREYRVFLNDISKIDRLYEEVDSFEVRAEVNPWLRKARAKVLVKGFSIRLQELIQYTKVFEYCYSAAFLEEFFGLGLVILACFVQAMLGDFEASVPMFYINGYLFAIVMDLFFMCKFATDIQSQCIRVGDTLYFTLWYLMEPDVQKDISLIILRSQHPPKITGGKLMVLNLPSFLSTMGHIYSWLTVIRQLEFKINNIHV